MKRLSVTAIIEIVCLFFQFGAQAQNPEMRSIVPYAIAISYHKTSNLIFPYAIKNVDRGSADVLVQKAQGIDNILQLKAGREGFPETNLTVITADGKFYSFLVDYAVEPSALNLSFVTSGSKIKLKDHPVDASAFYQTSSLLKTKKGFLRVRTKSQKMRLALQGIYLKDNLMYFDINLKNKSMVDYLPESIQFFIQDRKRVKRTSVQQVEVLPMYQDTLCKVKGRHSRQLVFAFKPFTLSGTKELKIQFSEKVGGRNLVLTAKAKKLLRARTLNR
jgi:conjugative transposon TraN protein